MGNQHSKTSANSPGPTEAILAQWQNISSGHGAPIWRHRSSGQQLQQYKYMAQSTQDFNRLRNLFEFRRDSHVLVATRFFLDAAKRELCGNHHLVSMYVQKIPVRLSQLRDLPYPEILHLYNNTIAGFRDIYRKVGYFPIDETMVGINHQGRVKVWLHPDFSRDRPDKDLAADSKTESDMVVQVIRLLDRHSHNIGHLENISVFLLERGSANFGAAQAGLAEWAAQHAATIPEHMPTIANLIRAGHFGRMSSSRRSDSAVRHETSTSRVQHIHGLLSAAQKSHLPVGTKITTTETDDILLPSTSILPVSIAAPVETSAVPIYGHTPVGLRPLSPARILIQAQSPIPFGHSALDIRPHSPSHGHHTQLHPLLLRQNIPMSTFVHPRDAVTRATPHHAGPLGSAIFPRGNVTGPAINNEELLALQKRIQSELDRVNSLVNASNLSAQQRSAQIVVPAANPFAVNVQPPVGTLSPASSQYVERKPSEKLYSFDNPSTTAAGATNTVKYSSYQVGRNTPTRIVEPAQQTETSTTPTTFLNSITLQPYRESEIIRVSEPTTYQGYNSTANQPSSAARSPLSSTIERPNVYLLQEKTTTQQPTTTAQRLHPDLGIDSAEPSSLFTDPKLLGDTSSSILSRPYNSSTNYSQFRAAEVKSSSPPKETATTSASKPTESYTLGAANNATYRYSSETRNLSDLNQPSTSYAIRTEAPTSSVSGSYRVGDSSNTRVSQESTSQTLSNDGLIKRSFDRSTNYIRISAKGNNETTEGVKVLYQG